jgi:hypothetical protein
MRQHFGLPALRPLLHSPSGGGSPGEGVRIATPALQCKPREFRIFGKVLLSPFSPFAPVQKIFICVNLRQSAGNSGFGCGFAAL